MKNIKYIQLTKNRGWRGLAEAILLDDENNKVHSQIFTYSQDVWDDMLAGYMTFCINNIYHIVHFDVTNPEVRDKLPKPTQQRSILLKHITIPVTDVKYINKDDVLSLTNWNDRVCITHFKKNNNYHTKSDWNCIGIRVAPTI